MFSSALNIKAVRVTTTGLIAAFLAVCTVSVAPASASTTTAKSTQYAAASDGSGKQATTDGFHW